jgi:hypothetical protein
MGLEDFSFFFLYFFRRNKKKRSRLRLKMRLRPMLSLVRPQGQALVVVGVDALDEHVGVGVVVHPKFIFYPSKPCFVCFFAAQEKKKICASPISNSTWFQEYILNECIQIFVHLFYLVSPNYSIL